jgi:hypothetical protein
MTDLLYSIILERVKKKLVNKKSTAHAEVVLVKKLPAPLLPNIVWLELPNPTPASPFPGWSKMTPTRKTQISACITINSVNRIS